MLTLGLVKAQEIDYSAVKDVSTLLIPEAAFDSIDARDYIDCSFVPLSKDLDEKKAWAFIHQESGRFNPYTNKALQSNYGDFWLRFSIRNSRSKSCPLFCEIPHLKQVWTVDLKKQPRFRPLIHSSQKIWLPSFNSGFYLKLSPCQQVIFLEFFEVENGAFFLNPYGKRNLIQRFEDYMEEIIPLDNLQRSRNTHIDLSAQRLATFLKEAAFLS